MTLERLFLFWPWSFEEKGQLTSSRSYVNWRWSLSRLLLSVKMSGVVNLSKNVNLISPRKKPYREQEEQVNVGQMILIEQTIKQINWSWVCLIHAFAENKDSWFRGQDVGSDCISSWSLLIFLLWDQTEDIETILCWFGIRFDVF